MNADFVWALIQALSLLVGLGVFFWYGDRVFDAILGSLSRKKFRRQKRNKQEQEIEQCAAFPGGVYSLENNTIRHKAKAGEIDLLTLTPKQQRELPRHLV